MPLPCKPGQTSRPPGLPETQNLPVGAGFIPPANPAPPQTPRDDASIVPYMGLQWPRGLHFPGWPPCFPGSVGRAFTPAAPLKFKTGNIPAAAGPGGMRASRPTFARAAVAIPFGRSFPDGM